jgi:hypothetical protein
MKYVVKQDMKNMIPDRLALYHSMIRNHYYLPGYKSGLCTVAYMLKVKNKQYWVPRFKDVKLAPCPLSPPKKQIVVEVFKTIRENKLNLNLGFAADEHNKVDLDWITKVLSTLDSNHDIFSKDFLPTVKEKMSDCAVIEDDDAEFLKGLPKISGLAKFKNTKARGNYLIKQDRMFMIGQVNKDNLNTTSFTACSSNEKQFPEYRGKTPFSAMATKPSMNFDQRAGVQAKDLLFEEKDGGDVNDKEDYVAYGQDGNDEQMQHDY